MAARAQWLVMEIAQVDEAEAQRLLALCDQQVKVTAVMSKRGVAAENARELLYAANGFLRRVINTD